MDDNHPFADKSSTKSISLIQNWDSISDKEFFEKKVHHKLWLIIYQSAVGSDCSRASSCLFFFLETIKSQRRLSLQILKLIDVPIVF